MISCPFFNLRNKRDFILVVAWTLAALLDTGPYPALAFTGEQGVAKSTASRIFACSSTPTARRCGPCRGAIVSFSSLPATRICSVFDNVSGLQPWLSDTLCRLSSGGGFAVRSLFSNNDEVLFNASRPIILNGIGDIITVRTSPPAPSSLAWSRSRTPPARRKMTCLRSLTSSGPRILGALFDAISIGLQRRPSISLPELPRMADFAEWATACETAFWPSGTFMNAYSENLLDVVDTVIEANLIASTMRQFAEEEAPWKGTASDLLNQLRVAANESTTRSRDWPNSPRALADELRRAATFLRKVGIEIAFDRIGKHRTRTISIDTLPFPSPERVASPSSAASASSATHISLGTPADAEIAADADRFLADAEADAEPRKADAADISCVRHNPLKDKAADAADAADDERPPYLGAGKGVLPKGRI